MFLSRHGSWRLATALSSALVALFAALPAARAQSSTVSVLHSFASGEANYGRAALVEGGDGYVYSSSGNGGANGYGTVFRIKADGSGYQSLHSFQSSDGTYTYGGVALGDDGYVYGAAQNGGYNNFGTVFRLKRDGSAFQVLHSFTYGSDGAYPWSAPIIGSDGRLYGTAIQGGTSNYGVVYAMNRDGTGFAVLHSFSVSTDGAYVYGRLTQASNGRLYGTTNSGGPSGRGTVFGLATDGSGFTVVTSFQAGGANPLSGVMQASDGQLYGGTQGGGSNGYGVFYSVGVDGSGFRILHNFNYSSEGANTYNAVPIEAMDGAIYSTVYAGGPLGAGAAFKINKDGSGFAVVGNFGSSVNAGYPLGGITQLADGSLVGVAYQYGAYGFGCFWKLGPSITGPLSATAYYNTPFTYTITAGGSPTSFGATNLPSGLSVNPATGIISGSPTVIGSFSVGLSATGTIGTGTATLALTVNKATAAVTLGSLDQTYDGTVKSATATTTPGNLTVNFNYSGPSLPPINAGSYTVTGIVSDPFYTGSSSSILTIAKAPLTITLGNLTQSYDGVNRHPVTAVTSPAGVATTITYNGSATAPLAVGTYAVAATSANSNYTGNAAATLTVNPGTASVALGNLTQTYDGSAKPVTVSTSPAGLGTSVTYNGSTTAPANAGNYAVVATVVDPNYVGSSASGTLVINPATATLTLGNLTQPYDGTPKSVSVSSSVAGLPVGVTYSGSAAAPTAVGSYVVVATSTNPNYTASATATLQITDTIPPQLTLPANLTLEATGAAGATATFAATATDNVTASPAIAYSIQPGSTFALGTTSVNVTATDDAGNVAQGSFTVTVQDTTVPTITAPANIVTEATSADGAVATFTASATDLVDGDVTVTSDYASGATFPLGSTAITLTATDKAGNVAHAVFSVTVHDTTAPVIAPQDNLVAEATGPNGATVSFTPSANDVVSGAVSVVASPASGSTFALGETTVTLTATDAAGNSATNTFTVTVRDTTAPAISAPANRVVEATSAAGAVVTFDATATDLVDGAVVVVAAPASGSTFALGTTAVTLTATDKAGNTTTATFSVTVRDTTAPALHVPGNLTVEATSAAGAVATLAASATDAVTASPVIGYSKASGSVFALGSTVVKVTATDAAGNEATGSFTVTVVDTTAPALTVPANQVIEATSAAGAVATFTATAADAVTASPAITYSIASGSTFALGTTTVNVTAKDSAGNTSTGSFTVTVRDTTAPALVVPANQTIEATSAAGAVATFAATATDIVTASPTIAYSVAPGSTFAIGTTTVSVTATDAAGNQSTGTFTIMVRDTTAPSIKSVAASPNTIWPPNKKMVPVAITVSSADTVGVASVKIVSVVTNEPDGTTQWDITGNLTLNIKADRLGNGSGRIYTITVEARDAAGNATQKTVTVSVPHDQGK